MNWNQEKKREYHALKYRKSRPLWRLEDMYNLLVWHRNAIDFKAHPNRSDFERMQSICPDMHTFWIWGVDVSVCQSLHPTLKLIIYSMISSFLVQCAAVFLVSFHSHLFFLAWFSFYPLFIRFARLWRRLCNQFTIKGVHKFKMLLCKINSEFLLRFFSINTLSVSFWRTARLLL